MRKFFPFILAILLTHWSIAAQDVSQPAKTDAPQAGESVSPTPTPKPKPRPKATPSPTPKPKKPSLFHRFFYGTPTPSPTPKPQVKTRAIKKTLPAEAKPSSTAKAGAKPEVKAVSKAKPSPAIQPAPTPVTKKNKVNPAPSSTPEAQENEKKRENLTGETPFVPAQGNENAQKKNFAAAMNDDEKEKERYREMKAVAQEDKEIKALKGKADAATDDDAQRAAMKKYYKALYQKIRTLDPGLTDRTDRMEKAMVKRIDGGVAE